VTNGVRDKVSCTDRRTVTFGRDIAYSVFTNRERIRLKYVTLYCAAA